MSQVRLTRGQPGASGNICWGIRALTENRRGLCDALQKGAYAQQALAPVFSWLDNQPPAPPRIWAFGAGGQVKLHCKPAASEPVWRWLVQTRSAGAWITEIVPGSTSERVFLFSNKPDAIAVAAIDRCGNASEPAVLERQ